MFFFYKKPKYIANTEKLIVRLTIRYLSLMFYK